jgi:formamidopyrimidine-DNA glycosylase
VLGLERLGKYLVLGLDDGSGVLLHLGMTGQMFMESANNPRLLRTQQVLAGPSDSFEPDVHTHLQFEFTDGGTRVFFRDVRKFGKVRWLPDGTSDPRLKKLGVDALSATGEDLYAAAQRRKSAIKTLLLDQGVLAGVGNIYADEALFLAGIHPERAACRISRPRCEALVASIRKVLLRSIETGGSSISDYVTPDGSDGGYQNERRVYARTGQPCSVCRSPIRRKVLGQRSTHYCAQCQR